MKNPTFFGSLATLLKFYVPTNLMFNLQMNICSLPPPNTLVLPYLPPPPPCTKWWHTLLKSKCSFSVFSQALWVTENCLITVHMLHKIVNLCLSSKSISNNSLWPPLVTDITDQISEHWLKMKNFVVIRMTDVDPPPPRFTFVVHSRPIIKQRLIDFF